MQTSPIIFQIIFVSIFVIVLFELYLIEARLLVRFFLNKFIRKAATGNFLSPKNCIVHVLALSGIACFVYGFFIEPYWVEVKTITIATDKLKSISIRLVQISDLHCDTKVRNEKKLAKLINPLQPDLIVFTGDAINSPEALPVFKNALAPLRAKIAKLAVAGNIDVAYWRDRDLFANTGFQLLNKKTVKFTKNGEVFYVSGLSYKYWPEWPDLLAKVPEGAYSIFLSHIPDLVEKMKRAKPDLYLAGHTHGGQVALPFFGALITMSSYGKKYEAGLYDVGDCVLYVNRGLGMEGGWVPRVRFLSRPEITVINIVPRKPQGS